MKLNEARRHAEYVGRLLAPALLRWEVAGSIRRGKADVKDIEIVAIARPRDDERDGPVVFGKPESALPPIDRLIARLIREDALGKDPDLKRDGPKAKRFLLVRDHNSRHLDERAAVDLFLVEAASFGAQLAIRTGDADFSKALVTPRAKGGLLPPGLEQEGGALWRGEEQLDCPDEAAYFAHLGLAVPDPAKRDRWLVGALATTITAAMAQR